VWISLAGCDETLSASDETLSASDELQCGNDETLGVSDELQCASDELQCVSDGLQRASDETLGASDETLGASDELQRQVSTVPQVETELDGYIAVYQAEADAEAALKKAVKARKDMDATAVARFEAIRASLKSMLARGTMGRKQKAKIKGTVPAASPAPAAQTPTPPAKAGS
jgi:hypothetical protein